MKQLIAWGLIMVLSCDSIFAAGDNWGRNAGQPAVKEIRSMINEHMDDIHNTSADLGKNFAATPIEKLLNDGPVIVQMAIITAALCYTGVYVVKKGCDAAYNSGAALYDWATSKTAAEIETNKLKVAESQRKIAEEHARIKSLKQSLLEREKR